MKISENQQVRGILIGVLFGLIAAFALQAFDVALWVCLGAGMLLGLEAGFFAATPKKTLACHRTVIDKVNIELHLPKIDWEALKQSWSWKQAWKVAGDFGATILSAVFVIGYGALLVYSVVHVGEWKLYTGDYWLNIAKVFTLVEFVFSIAGAAFWFFALGSYDEFTREPRKIPFNGWYFRCKTYRQRVLLRGVVGSVGGSVALNILIAWIALSVCLFPFYVIAAVCKLARQDENAGITVGIIMGVIIGFIFGYTQDFALTMELLACFIGAVAGLIIGALAVWVGQVADACKDAYMKVTVWKHI